MSRPTLLCVAHDFPLPADNGSSVYVLGVLRLLAEWGDVRLIVAPRPSTAPADVVALEEQTGARLELLGSAFLPRRSHLAVRSLAIATRTPPWFVMWFNQEALDALRRLLREAHFVVALDDFAAQYLVSLPPTRPATVLLKHKVYGAPSARGLASSAATRARDALARRLARANEFRTLAAADATAVTSDEEDARLQAVYGRRADAVLPAGVDETPAWTPRSGREPNALWLGSLNSRPNREGLVALLRAMEATKASFRLTVVGPGADDEVRDRAAALNVTFEGFVDDLSDVLSRASVAVVPLWSGGGVRLKTMTLLASGIPLVATPAALEALHVSHGEHLLVAGTPHECVERINDVLADPTAMQAMGARARRLMLDEHGWHSRRPIVRQLLDVAAHRATTRSAGTRRR